MRLILSTLGLLCSLCMSAQTISGVVHTDQGKPAANTSVFLLQQSDSSLYKTAVTSSDGSFNIPASAGNYLLRIELQGYQLYYSAAISIGTANETLPTISLAKPVAGNLNEVTVNARKPYIEVRADKLVVNVGSSPVNAGGTVLDVLSRSPGVFVDQNDIISLKGKQGVTVMIDGRIQPLSAVELASLLRSMPAASADKIELITNPSAKYDAAGVSGIINIRTKRDARLGLNGSLNANIGKGKYTKGGAGINLTFRDKSWTWFANYNYGNRPGYRDIHFYREFAQNGVFNTAYDQHNFSKVNYQSHSTGVGADYKASKATTIGFMITGSYYSLGTEGLYHSDVLDSSRSLTSYFTTDNQSYGHYYNFAPNLHFQHSFDTLGTELTMDIDYARYLNKPRQEFTSQYFFEDGSLQQPDYLLLGRITGDTRIRSLKADFTHPLQGDAHIDGGIKSSYVTADNEPKFYDRSSGTEVYDSAKSDHFIYNEYINAAYVNGGKEFKKWGIQAGLRAEHTIVKGHELTTDQSFDHQYIQLFPTIDLSWHINGDNDAGLTFSRRITRPNYQELNPYKFFVDATTFKAGNPFLQPALEYSMELSHVYKQRLITSVSYSVTSDVIVLVVQPNPDQSNASIQTNQNLSRMHYFGLNGSYTIPVTKWWNSTTNLDFYYNSYQGNLSSTNLNADKITFGFYSTNTFTLPYQFLGELSGYYNSPQVYGFLNMKSAWGINAGIQRSFFDKRATVKMNISDIFLKNVQRGSSEFTDYSQSFINESDSRVFTVDFTYRFGKRTVPGLRQHRGGAEDEKQRVGA